MSEFDFDVCVVGAGAVGLATGRALALAGKSVLVLESESAIGQGISSRNSEVIHAGLYYPTGSLKARLCVEGRRLLYPYLEARGVAFDRCGKLVIATEDSELSRLDAIESQAVRNGVEGIWRLSAEEVQSLEPGLNCVGALLSETSGVFDSHGYMAALEGDITNAGGAVVVATPFESAAPLTGGGFVVHTGGAEATAITVRQLVIAAGLGAQTCAAAIEHYPLRLIPTLYYGKGRYFRLSGKAPFRHLIYPPPIPGALGTHYRRDLGGQAVFGPDLIFVHDIDYGVDASARDAFVETIRRFWPDLDPDALVADYAGIRPKLHGPGEAQPDFRIDGAEVHGMAGLVTLFGIESPGLTSSLAIGDYVSKMLAG